MPWSLTPPHPSSWQVLLNLALAEDIGPADVTSQLTIASDANGHARIEARQALVACGLFVAQEVFRRVDPQIAIEPCCAEADELEAGQILMRLQGGLHGILAGERTALNFLARLCGIATLTRRYVREIEGTGSQIVDTRKTLPGWRVLDKFAVLAGGGTNHRFALYDGILLKDNHIAAAGGVKAAVEMALARAPAGLRVQVEVESAAEAEAACQAGADFLLIDNRTPEEVRDIVQRCGERALLEVSGGITLENLRQYAQSGVARIAIGAITHSAPACDIALELDDRVAC